MLLKCPIFPLERERERERERGKEREKEEGGAVFNTCEKQNAP